MSLNPSLLIATIFIFLLWGVFITTILWGYKKMIYDPCRQRRREMYERARRIADRRG